MTIETALYPTQLNATLPPQSDIVREGAGHLRLLKTVVKTTFPNLGGAWNATQAEANYIVGVTSPIQVQINSKGAIAGQAWTGTHSFPNTTTVGPLTPTIQGYLSTATSDVQAQLNSKGAIAGQTWTGAHVFNGTATLPAATTIGAVTAAELAHISGVTSPIQTQFAAKASLSGATYTGAHNYSGASSVTLPAATSIGSITQAELGYVDGVTAPIQAQINSKAAKAGDTYTGTHNFTSAAISVPTLAPGASGNSAASVDYANALAFASALPSQTGNSGKFITTNGVTASWSDAIDGNLSFTGAARRITGDFSNASLANRLMFQTSAANSPTTLGVLPSGTSEAAALAAYAKSDPANASSIRMLATSIDGRLDANRSGAGNFLPMTFYTGGAERLRIDQTTGNVLATSGVLGYGVGAGGTAVQATSKSTAVTLNKPSGRVTMHNAALAAGASVSWVCVNTYVQVNCCVVVSGIYDGGAVYPANYQIDVSQVGTGYFEVRVKNITASALSDALPIQFDVFQGAVS